MKKDYPQGLFYDNRSDYVMQNIVGSSYSKIMAAESLVKMYNEKDVRKEKFLMSPGIFRNMRM